MFGLGKRQSAPAENFTGIYKGDAYTLEKGEKEFSQCEGECTFVLNHGNDGSGTASIYLAGETIGEGVPASISLYNLTLRGIIRSSGAQWQGTFCFKNRVMMLTISGILKDTKTKIKLNLVRVDEWKRPFDK